MPHAHDNDLEGRAATALDEERATSREFTDEFRERAFNFDADDALTRSTAGSLELLKPFISEQLEDLRGAQVGQGRLSTGFGFEDQDRLFRDIFDRFNSQLASRSLQAAGLNLQNQGQLGDFSNLSRNRFLEFLSASQDRETAKENAEGGFLDDLEQVAGIAGTLIPFF